MQAASLTRPPGRPTVVTPEIRAALCEVIRRTGCSDSAAAHALGLSTSSLSRGKQAEPGFALCLRQAREQFREAQLDVILAAARAESGRGWRAAAWLLERIFPEDYSARAKERAQFQELAAAADESTSSDATASTAETELVPCTPVRLAKGTSHNSRNSPPSLAEEPSPLTSLAARSRPTVLTGPLVPRAA